jgi:ATPase family associated with various cellular activities (AAA)
MRTSSIEDDFDLGDCTADDDEHDEVAVHTRATTTDGAHDDKDTEETVYAPSGSLPSARHLYEGTPDRHGRTTWTTVYPDDLEEPIENKDSAQYALLVRSKKSYDGRKKLEIYSIVVQSTVLKEVLGMVLKDYPGINTKLERVEFKAPFEPFVHRWDQLATARAQVTNLQTRTHVNLFWKLLDEELRDTIREKVDHVANGVVKFSNIWTIFEPGCLVFSRSEDHERIYKFTSGNYTVDGCGVSIYRLNCQYLDFDGDHFGYGATALTIREFGGTTEITNLKVFPLEHHPRIDDVKERLLARGRLFESFKGYHFKAYEGIATGQGFCGTIRFSVNSRVILDTAAFNRFNPNRKVHLTKISASSSSSTDPDPLSDRYAPRSGRARTGRIGHQSNGTNGKATSTSDFIESSLSETQLLIATSSLRGYSLKDKKWLDFYIPIIKEITWNEDAFSSLVAPPDQKELILAFAQSQLQNQSSFDDVIQGKGRGIIMLLSGPPGVGKTLTAESVAETMKVPLYMVGAGDLGDEPSSVESTLSNILEMVTKWKAVLLLDEADVFLEARSIHDLERNKLVSIFLRLLEYYEGVLFLTTNRVDNIDAAFESRIHLSLQYDELDKPSRKHVWETFLSRAITAGNKTGNTNGLVPPSDINGGEAAKTSGFTEEEIDKLADRPMNGRQIKNVLKTSQLLASKQGVQLGFSHVDTVMRLRERNARKRSVDELS